VRTSYGWHVIQVLQVTEPTRPFDDAVREELLLEAESAPVRGEEVNRYLKQLRDDATIDKRYP
jgi:parvulin-like peptidyl-prolyl isomerase